MSLSNRVVSMSSVYNVKDYTSDTFIVTQKELIFYKDYIYCNYSLDKNFNRINQFIGVNSEERQWEIAESGRTLERDLVYKEYIEIDAVTSGTGSSSIVGLNTLGIETYLDTFDTTSTKKNVILSFIDSNTETLDTSIVELGTNGGGNSLMFNFGFKDNKVNDNYIETINSQSALNYVSYTDENAELTDLSLTFVDDLPYINFATAVVIADTLPKVPISYAGNKIVEFIGNDSWYVKKDRRDVLKGNYQLQQLSNSTNTIILGKQLSRRNRLITR